MATVPGEYYFRQLEIIEGKWRLLALNPAYPALDIRGKEDVVAVVVMKKAGKRKEQKSYV